MGIGAVAAGAAIAASATTVASTIANDVSGPAGGGGVNAGSGGGGGGGLNVQQSQYAYYGPHMSTTPMGGSKEPSISSGLEPVEYDSKAGKAHAATRQEIGTTPTQGADEEAAQGKADMSNMWADRLNRYLDYNTRQLG